MTTLIILFKTFLIAWLITQLGPLFKDIKTNFNFWKIFGMLTSCLKCVSFWVGISLSNNLFIGITAALIGYMIDKYIFKGQLKL